MSEDAIDRRDYGRLEATVDQLVKEMHQMKTTMEQMNETMQQARGGWRAIAFVSGVAATVGAAIAWVATHIRFG